MLTALQLEVHSGVAQVETAAQDWGGFVPSEPRVRVRDGQQRRVRVEGLRNIKARPLSVTKRHIWVCV